MSPRSELRDDLLGEQDSLDRLVVHLSENQWCSETPSPGWSIADQIGHLAYFDAAAAESISQPDRYAHSVATLVRESAGEPETYTLREFREMNSDQLLQRWRENRAALARAATTLDDSTRVDWYGRSMSGRSFLTARLMETWAHGTDIADALTLKLEPTDRLRHIAHLGFITRDWSYKVRGEEPPTGRVRLELTSPSGELWLFGENDDDETLSGLAEDYCLVVTQRRHVEDTSLQVGPLGREWMLRAQAFAGPPTIGPARRA